MSSQQTARWSRRQFLGGLTLAGRRGFSACTPGRLAAEPPPETAKLRLVQSPAICISPQYVAEELLQGEGFSDVQYVRMTGISPRSALAAGEVDIA